MTVTEKWIATTGPVDLHRRQRLAAIHTSVETLVDSSNREYSRTIAIVHKRRSVGVPEDYCVDHQRRPLSEYVLSPIWLLKPDLWTQWKMLIEIYRQTDKIPTTICKTQRWENVSETVITAQGSGIWLSGNGHDRHVEDPRWRQELSRLV